jgi:hypothetical protein
VQKEARVRTRRERFLLAVLALLAAAAGYLLYPQPAAAPRRELAGQLESDKASAAVRVLFVGNSYTYVHDLPSRVRALGLAAASPIRIYVESTVAGGARLRDLHDHTNALAKLHAGGFTHVVIQGQSVEPLTDPESFRLYAARLAKEAKAVGVVPVFYETWARQDGDEVYKEDWSGRSPQEMQARLRAEYERVAAASGAELARVGDAREAAMRHLRSGATLFEPDGSHPSALGAELGACVVFGVLTGRSAMGTRHPDDVPREDADVIEEAARQVTRAGTDD